MSRNMMKKGFAAAIATIMAAVLAIQLIPDTKLGSSLIDLAKMAHLTKTDSLPSGETVAYEPTGESPTYAKKHTAQASHSAGVTAQGSTPQNKSASSAFSKAPVSDRALAIFGSMQASPSDRKNLFVSTEVSKINAKYPNLLTMTLSQDDGSGVEKIVSKVEMAADHIVVRLADGILEKDLVALTERLGGTIMRPLRVAGSPAYLISLNSKDTSAVMDALNAYSKEDQTIACASPDFMVHAGATPNDPSFLNQWALNNSGQVTSGYASAGKAHADIGAVAAWDISTGQSNVIVGVIDTGIDYNHPDLAANIWINPGECGLDANGRDKRTNGIDDDGDGYVDDWRGWNFSADNNDPADDYFHGTHCAGIIGAAGNNSAGVAGVCWNVKLAALKFMDVTGSGWTSDALEALQYATKKRFNLTSNSWGGGGYDQLFKSAIDAAGAQGMLFVTAAGNSAQNIDATPSYPSSYQCSNVIAVAALDHSDALASFSNYGAAGVHVGAPGVYVYNTLPVQQTAVMKQYGIGGSYGVMSGTSMACPHVAGECALVEARGLAFNGAAVKNLIMNTVDPVSALSGKSITGGRINVASALRAMTTTANNAAFVAQSVPQALTVGQTTTVTIQMKNTGTSVWTTASGYSLGSMNPVDNTTWGLKRANLAVGVSVTPGATATFRFNITAPATAGNVNLQWRMINNSTGAFGDITPNAVVSVNTTVVRPSILTQPTNTLATLGQSVRFNITAAGTPLFYQWKKNGSNVSGATNDSYVTPAVVLADAGAIFMVTVSNSSGSVNSTNAVLRVNRPPAVNVTANLTGGGAPLAVLFNATATDPDGDTVTYAWNFGDGSAVSPIRNPSHTYTRYGTFLAIVNVSDGRGGNGTAAISITVRDTTAPAITARSILLKGAVDDITAIITVNGIAATNNGGTWQSELALSTTSTVVTIVAIDQAMNASTQRITITSGNTAAAIAKKSAISSLADTKAMSDLTSFGGAAVIEPLTLGGEITEPLALNAGGAVVGTAQDKDGVYHGFATRGDEICSFGASAGGWSSAHAINADGIIVGSSSGSDGGENPFIWNGANVAPLQTLAGGNGRAASVNVYGMSVGWSVDANKQKQAMIWDAQGHGMNLNGLLPAGSGWTLTEAQFISDNNTVVGIGMLDGAKSTFMLKIK